jgi:hypothetical protein
MDYDVLIFILLFMVTPSCLWLLSRLSSSKTFKKCNTILLLVFFVNTLLSLMPPFVFSCDGSVLYDYRNCINSDDELATTIGRVSFLAGLIVIATYTLFITLSFIVYAYKKFQNRS